MDSASSGDGGLVPRNTEPAQRIQGGPAIRLYHILNDRRHVLTKDTEENVALYDVLKACKVEDLGRVDFEQEIKKRSKMVFVPNWFNVDLKTGVRLHSLVLSLKTIDSFFRDIKKKIRDSQMLTIHLGQDENDCFSAWVSARDTGLADNDSVDQKGQFLKKKKHILHNFE